jgi:DNA-binding response OmpR family regulator
MPRAGAAIADNVAMRILVVEDDPRMSALVRRGLIEEGHEAQAARTGPAALDLVEAGAWDVVVLDIRLPGIDGLDVLRRMRADGRLVPVLMLTARDAAGDVVTALDAGADDYLTKPFSFDVLLARLRALGRRGPVSQPVVRRVADLVLDTGARTVSRAGQPITLTRTEYNLLEHLVRAAGRVLSRQHLTEQVWGYERDVERNTLDAFVKLLRHKVDRPGWTPLIHTVRGVGYVLREEREP